MVLNVIKYPAKTLRRRASRVEALTDVERRELCDMAETMYLNQGVGLAATQVGIYKEMLTVDIGKSLLKMVNPVIRKKGRACESLEEGCLSVPGVQVKIKRPKAITVEYLDEYGNPARLEAEGLLARVIQHEIDHLFGRLIVDYLSPIKRFFSKKDLTKSATL